MARDMGPLIAMWVWEALPPPPVLARQRFTSS